LIVAEGSGAEKPLPGGIRAAVAAARRADVVVLAVGESQNMSGEAQSRAEIVLPEPQQKLAEAVARLGKPMVVVLKNGRALALEGAVADARAILVTWFLGTETGNAIADVLFGAYSPSARLPISFPRSPGQQPYHYSHKASGRPDTAGELGEYKTHFRGIPHTALYPFGHGLNYGRIEYSGLTLSTRKLAANEELVVQALLTNHGRRPAEEVAQLYVHDRAASVTRPVRELKAFSKVAIAPGKTETVTFRLRRSDLLFVGPDLKLTVEPGLFDIWVAPSAESEGVAGTFDLLA
jgi:beta-glucosidase